MAKNKNDKIVIFQVILFPFSSYSSSAEIHCKMSFLALSLV